MPFRERALYEMGGGVFPQEACNSIERQVGNPLFFRELRVTRNRWGLSAGPFVLCTACIMYAGGLPINTEQWRA
jgi:hypothetical protein